MSQRNRFFVPAQKYMLRMEVKGNTGKKTAIVAGASGLTGSFLLQLLAQDKSFDRITVLSRKAMKPALPKVREVVVDFNNLGRYEFWPDAHVLYCCIGTTIKKAGSKDDFRKVDFDIPLKLAEQCARYNIDFHFMSSVGANAESGNFYLKTKGETEEALKQAGLDTLYIYRPSILLGPRRERRVGESIGKFFTLLFSVFLLGPLKKYRGINIITIGKAMIQNTKNAEPGVHVLESDEIKKRAEN